MKKNNLIILSQYFPPDVSGGATRAINYSKCLGQQNYNVTVITAFPHQHGPVPKKYRNKLSMAFFGCLVYYLELNKAHNTCVLTTMN